MSKLTWDDLGDRFYETGVDHGVLYIPDETGAYTDGVAWNGITTVTESPSGAEPNAQYADNVKYLNLFSAEEFSATLEAFTFPDEFAQFDGLGSPSAGVYVGQQVRKMFGLSYRTKIGSDVDGEDHGYKIHLVYGCSASPSEKAYTTVNDSPSAIAFSWSISTTPVAVTNYRPTSLLTIDSTKVDEDALASLEAVLYGSEGVDPSLPVPDDVIAYFSGTITEVEPGIPTYVGGTHTLTIPATVGLNYMIDGAVVAAGDVVITKDTLVKAEPKKGYVIKPGFDDDWFFDYS